MEGMDGEYGRDEKALFRFSGRPKEKDEQQASGQEMDQNINQMMAPSVQPEQINIDHMGNPG